MRREAVEGRRNGRGQRLGRCALGLEQRLQPDLVARLGILIGPAGRIGACMRRHRGADRVIRATAFPGSATSAAPATSDRRVIRTRLQD